MQTIVATSVTTLKGKDLHSKEGEDLAQQKRMAVRRDHWTFVARSHRRRVVGSIPTVSSIRCAAQRLDVDSQPVNTRVESSRQRYIVIFAKNAIDLEDKLNDPRFVPDGYKIVQLAFNSVQAEFLTILENEWK
jgi:hypothetical protein